MWLTLSLSSFIEFSIFRKRRWTGNYTQGVKFHNRSSKPVHKIMKIDLEPKMVQRFLLNASMPPD